jgi:hypothetical protein
MCGDVDKLVETCKLRLEPEFEAFIVKTFVRARHVARRMESNKPQGFENFVLSLEIFRDFYSTTTDTVKISLHL